MTEDQKKPKPKRGRPAIESDERLIAEVIATESQEDANRHDRKKRLMLRTLQKAEGYGTEGSIRRRMYRKLSERI